jgi:DNA-binding SARP family transcriptional activator
MRLCRDRSSEVRVAVVEFLILGPLEVRRAGTAVPIRAGRHRALLALLLLEANSIVPAERLIDQLWDGHPPNGAANTLQAYVSQLRRLLEPGRPSGTASDLLLTQARGYLLRAEDDAIDAWRFRRLAQAGRRALSGGDSEGGSSMLRDALSLWRGAALVDFADGWAEPERRHLEELRLSTFEDWIDAELALGQDTSIVSELQAAVRREPLRERLRGQLMMALYQSGRQADALTAYSDARRMLVTRLGIEPGPDLRQLQTSILTQDPNLGAATQMSLSSRASTHEARKAQRLRSWRVTTRRERLTAGVALILVGVALMGWAQIGRSNPIARAAPSISARVAFSHQLRADRRALAAASAQLAAGRGDLRRLTHRYPNQFRLALQALGSIQRDQASHSADPTRLANDAMAAEAVSVVGTPYTWGGASPAAGFDSSGLVMWLCSRRGVPLPHNATAQYEITAGLVIDRGPKIDYARLEVGDLMFFDRLGHVSVYIGRGYIVDAPHANDFIQIVRLRGSRLHNSYYGATRVRRT